MADSQQAASSGVARAPHLSLWALAILAFVVGPWAVFQWMELIIALDGGPVSCAVAEGFDCTAVWFAPAAKALHSLSGLPVAAWGLVWSFAALVAVLRLAIDRTAGKSLETGVLGVRIVAAAGIAGVLAFAGISLAEGVFCPTCLATYGLVLVFAAVAVVGLGQGSGAPFVSAATAPVIAVVVGWGVLLYPGLSTPLEPSVELPPPEEKVDAEPAGAPKSELQRLVSELPPRGREALAAAVAGLRKAPKNADLEPRQLHGPADAPLVITDFSDLRCGHCRQLAETLHEMSRRLGGRFTEDVRYFPLSHRCNPEVPEAMVDPTGVRCFAARALLCLEGHKDVQELRRRLFSMQQDLTKAKVSEVAEELTGTSPAELETCAASPEVSAKLEADIAYAMRYDLQGTPLLLLNGREVPAHPTLLYILLLANGDPDHPAFASLPAVR